MGGVVRGEAAAKAVRGVCPLPAEFRGPEVLVSVDSESVEGGGVAAGAVLGPSSSSSFYFFEAHLGLFEDRNA